MGFFGGTSYEQQGGQATNDMVQGLNNFNPWGYMRGMGTAGRMYKNDIKDLYGGKDVSQIAGLKPMFAAGQAAAASANRMTDRALASGDAGVTSPEMLAARKAAAQRQNNTAYMNMMPGMVADYRQEAMGGYQQARENQGREALGAGALALQGKDSALDKYLKSFMPVQKGGIGDFLGGMFKFGVNKNV